MAALKGAYPYDVPEWMPQVLVQLVCFFFCVFFYCVVSPRAACMFVVVVVVVVYVSLCDLTQFFYYCVFLLCA